MNPDAKKYDLGCGYTLVIAAPFKTIPATACLFKGDEVLWAGKLATLVAVVGVGKTIN